MTSFTLLRHPLNNLNQFVSLRVFFVIVKKFKTSYLDSVRISVAYKNVTYKCVTYLKILQVLQEFQLGTSANIIRINNS